MAGHWQLSLEQQTDLSITSGNKTVLADALRRGADLRVYMTTDRYEETIYFQQTYAGTGENCAGLMSHHHGYVHHGDDVEQPNMSIFRYDTSGTFAQLKWLWGDIALDEGQTYPYGIYKWFTCDRWRVVYEHDATGQAIAGDLDELKMLVRQGRTIQVGIRQLFGLVANEQGGPEHISFLTTMQPVISGGHVQSNCDLVVIGAPRWPIVWQQGLHIATVLPSTSGALLAFVAEPGKLPFTRLQRWRAMQWLVAASG